MSNQPYGHVGWHEGADWDEYYSMLRGPNGFGCCLTEPEDRNWFRDGSIVVDKLNEQHAKIERLENIIRGLAEYENLLPGTKQHSFAALVSAARERRGGEG